MKRALLVYTSLCILSVPLLAGHAHASVFVQTGSTRGADKTGEGKGAATSELKTLDREREKNANKFYKLGVEFGHAGRYLEALEAFRRTILLDPNNADAHFGLGHAHLDLGQWKEAVEAFKRVILLSPKDDEAYHNLGTAYLKLNRYEEAIEAFKQIILIKRNRADARYNIANAFFKLGRYDAAVVNYKDVLHFKPNFADVHTDLGLAYIALGQETEAIESFRRAIRFNDDDAYAHNNLGLLLYRQGLFEEAVKYLTRAERLDPGDDAIRDNLMLATTTTAPAGRSDGAVGDRVAVINADASNNGGITGRVDQETPLRWRGRVNLIREGDLKIQNRLGQLANVLVPPVTAVTPNPMTTTKTAARGAKTAPSSPAEARSVPARNDAGLMLRGNSVTSPASSVPAAGGGFNTPPATEPVANTGGGGAAAGAATTPATTSPARTAAPGAVAPTSTAAAATPDPSGSLINIYRVGTGDVLDIRLLNVSTYNSTLYTVLAGGVLEYPLAGEPLVVSGLTTEQVGEQIAAALQRRAVHSAPQVMVSVREYASHTVIVSGLVNDPGNKVIRREAVPLYVVIADAQPRPEAGQVAVTSHNPARTTVVDLADTAAMNMLVRPGDVINVTVRPRQFYYIAGQVNDPGQKEFHSGITLTQAILASGGVVRSAVGAIRVARQGADDRLTSTSYNLRDIMGGKAPDPRLQPGDRIEVER